MQIVNVALPTLSRKFNAPLPDVQWTVIAYLLTLAIVIPASGWIGDRIGTKRTFLFALALFTAASALCGAAENLPELIAARALQGIGGGMLTPTGTAMLYRAYGPDQRARVARTLILPILVGPGVAPILGGVLTQTLSWRWVFLINVPVGIVMIAFAHLYLPEHREAPRGRIDLRGMLQSGIGLSALLYAISEGSVVGWAAPQIVVTGIRRSRTVVGVRSGGAEGVRADPAAGAAARATAACDQLGVRADDRRVPRQPLPDADLPAAGAAPVADRIRHDHIRRGDRRRRRVPDPRPAVPAARAAGAGRDRRDHADRVHDAVRAHLPRR